MRTLWDKWFRQLNGSGIFASPNHPLSLSFHSPPTPIKTIFSACWWTEDTFRGQYQCSLEGSCKGLKWPKLKRGCCHLSLSIYLSIYIYIYIYIYRVKDEKRAVFLTVTNRTSRNKLHKKRQDTLIYMDTKVNKRYLNLD